MRRAVAIGCAAVPFAFALVRAVRTGSDLRYLWLAMASTLGAIAVTTLWRSPGTASRRRAPPAIAAFASATLLAGLTGMLLGTTAGPGLLVVAAAFGFWSAAGSMLCVE